MARHRVQSLRSSNMPGKVSSPTITSVAPNTGTAAGGTAVTFTGTNFRKSANPAFSLGGVPCTAVVVTSKTTATAVSGAHGAGAVAAAVQNAANGDGYNMNGTTGAAYTYT